MKVTRLIEKLGGVSAVAKELSVRTGQHVTAGTVYRWRDRETISYRWRPAMAQLAADRKLTVPKELAMFIPATALSDRSAAE